MPSSYNIVIDMSFYSDLEFYEMETKIYDACQIIFDNFENINIRINKDNTFMIDGYQKTTTECSVKQVKVDNDKYDF